MQANPSQSNQDEDDIAQSGVLGLILEEHPAQLTVPELVRAMCRRVEDFGERDRVERAAGELVGAGLLHRQGAFGAADPRCASLPPARLRMTGS